MRALLYAERPKRRIIITYYFFSLFVQAGGRLRVQQLKYSSGRWIWNRPCHSRAPERMTVLRQSLRWPHWPGQILVRNSTTGGHCRRFSRRNGTERRASASSQWPNDAPPLHFHYGRPALVTSVTSLQYLWRGSHPVLSFPTITSSRPSLQPFTEPLRSVSEVSLKSTVADSRFKEEN